MPTGRRRLASSLRAAEPSSPNEAKALSNNPADNTIPVTTGSRDLDDAGDALKSMLGDEPTSPVLRCGSWPKGKANVAKTAIT